jgi:hypothetical protein
MWRGFGIFEEGRIKHMKIPNLALGPEWALLEMLCLGLTTPCEQEILEELMRSYRLNWGEMLEQSLRHKMLPLLAFYTTSSKLEETVPLNVKNHLRTVLDLNRHKIAVFRREAARIVKALDERGIRFVGTKGIVFESTLYEGNGSRYMNDIDFMIVPKYRDIVIDTMSQLGYQMGEFDWQAGEVKPHSRKAMMIYQLNPDHVPSFARLINDSVIRCVHVDFANSLTWTGSDFDVPVEIALAEISHQPLPSFPDIQMPCFSPVFQFIFTVLHLFREAWFERWLDWEQDVNLMKFADAARLWRANQEILESKEFVRTLEEFGIIDPVLWVLEHLDRTLHTGIVSALGLEGRVTELWLASARASGGKLRKWKGTMRERLHCKDRRKLFVDED